MKKSLMLFLVSTLIVGLVGCGISKNNESTKENTVLKEPPNLTLVSGSTKFTASKCSFEWSYPISEQTSSSSIACGANILDSKEDLNSFTPEPDSLTVTLDFELPPDSVSALCWSADDWGKTEVEGEPIPIEDDLTMTLKDGAYIYKINAEWKNTTIDEDSEVSYGFYTVSPEDASEQSPQ